eukprot:scaffold291153_cov14-Prasinocladus_malaysianus.AAC.1
MGTYLTSVLVRCLIGYEYEFSEDVAHTTRTSTGTSAVVNIRTSTSSGGARGASIRRRRPALLFVRAPHRTEPYPT